jgi:hypothetical protein
MITRYWDRRRFIRVPASGSAWWRSGTETGHCEIVDISPGGAGLRMSARKGSRLGDFLTLAIQLSDTETWLIAENARVARRSIDDDGVSRVGLEFVPRDAVTGRVIGGSPDALGFPASESPALNPAVAGPSDPTRA